jgi:dipeptidyl-peptidase-3
MSETLTAIVAASGTADQGAEPAAPARAAVAEPAHAADADFRVEVERFADVRILRYRVPGFEALDARTKKLLYCLHEAALCGREMTYDQKYRYDLAVKRTLEQIVRCYPGDRESADFRALTLYLKRVWFANGIHHQHGHDKLVPGFSAAAFAGYVRATLAEFPLRAGQSPR